MQQNQQSECIENNSQTQTKSKTFSLSNLKNKVAHVLSLSRNNSKSKHSKQDTHYEKELALRRACSTDEFIIKSNSIKSGGIRRKTLNFGSLARKSLIKNETDSSNITLYEDVFYLHAPSLTISIGIFTFYLQMHSLLCSSMSI